MGSARRNVNVRKHETIDVTQQREDHVQGLYGWEDGYLDIRWQSFHRKADAAKIG